MAQIYQLALAILGLVITASASGQDVTRDNAQKIALEAFSISQRIENATSEKTWVSGNHQIQAAILSVRSGEVTLRKNDGSEIDVKISKLEDSSRDQIDEFKKAKREESQFQKNRGLSINAAKLIGTLVEENNTLRTKLNGAQPQANKKQKPRNTQPAIVASALSVQIDESRIYIAKNDSEFGFLKSFLSVSYNGKHSTGGLFEIDGQATRPKISSTDPSVVEILLVGDTDSVLNRKVENAAHEQIKFKKGGTSEIVVELGGHVVKKNVTVVELPFEKYDSSAKVIETLGFPSSKKRFFVSWPDDKTIDKIWYNPSARESSTSGEHWRFEKYPGLVVSIVRENVRDIGSCQTESQ